MGHKSNTLSEKSQMQVLYCDSNYMTFWKGKIIGKEISGCKELGVQKGLNKNGHEGLLGQQRYSILIVMVVTRLYIC